MSRPAKTAVFIAACSCSVGTAQGDKFEVPQDKARPVDPNCLKGVEDLLLGFKVIKVAFTKPAAPLSENNKFGSTIQDGILWACSLQSHCKETLVVSVQTPRTSPGPSGIQNSRQTDQTDAFNQHS